MGLVNTIVPVSSPFFLFNVQWQDYQSNDNFNPLSVNMFLQLDDLEQKTVKWCRQILRNNPTAIRILKFTLNAVDDGHARLQELTGNTTLIFYGTEEGNEGKTAYVTT